MKTKAFCNAVWREKGANLDITSIEKETIICYFTHSREITFILGVAAFALLNYDVIIVEKVPFRSTILYKMTDF